jgi:hypothetical protein
MSVSIVNGNASNIQVDHHKDTHTLISIEGLSTQVTGIAKIKIEPGVIDRPTSVITVSHWPNNSLEGVQFDHGDDLHGHYTYEVKHGEQDNTEKTLVVSFNNMATNALKKGGTLTLIDYYR